MKSASLSPPPRPHVPAGSVLRWDRADRAQTAHLAQTHAARSRLAPGLARLHAWGGVGITGVLRVVRACAPGVEALHRYHIAWSPPRPPLHAYRARRSACLGRRRSASSAGADHFKVRYNFLSSWCSPQRGEYLRPITYIESLRRPRAYICSGGAHRWSYPRTSRSEGKTRSPEDRVWWNHFFGEHPRSAGGVARRHGRTLGSCGWSGVGGGLPAERAPHVTTRRAILIMVEMR